MELPKQLRIRTAKDMIDALRSTDSGIRISILRAIVQNPEKAAAYGLSEGLDIVDEMCDQVRNLVESPLRTLVLGALVAYKDPRVREVFKAEINASENAETITLAARYLSGEAEDDDRQTLSCLLLQNNSLTHARAAAYVMATYEHLSVRERLRIAMLGAADADPPGLGDETLTAWSAELHGPHAPRARRMVEAQGEGAFLYLRKRWDLLGDEDKTWLLEWGAAAYPVYTVELILLGLESGSEVVVLASLQAIPAMGASGAIFATHTGRFLGDPNPALRRAAVRAGAADVDWEAALATEENVSVRMEMLMRLAEVEGAVAAPVLIRFIEEGDYRICAAATSALKLIGKDAVELMKPLLKHPQQAVQVAAAQVLISAGEDLWLEEQVIC